MLNLDTHVLVFLVTDQLTAQEKKLLSGEEFGISGIVLWEISMLADQGRIEMDLDDPEVLGVLHRIRVWPLTLDVCRESRRLDFRGDPADEIIAATSVIHRVPLVTRDRAIRKSKVVPLAG